MTAPADSPAPDEPIQASYEVWETLRIASSGESRAGLLDAVGFILVGVAIVFAVAASSILNASASLEDEGTGLIVLFAVGAALPWLVAAALLLGFGALVRNSSRSLAIQVVSSPLSE